MSIKAIAFDKDGTLMRYEDFWCPVAEHAVEIILSEFDINKDKSRLFLDTIGAYDRKIGILCYGTYKDMADAFAKTLKTLGISCDSNRLYQLTVSSFHQSMRYGNIKPVCSNLPGVLSSLKKKGIILALVTADDLHGTAQFLNELKITDYFDEVCTFDRVHPSKPNPYYIKMMCQKYNLKPSEIIMVGDTSVDMDFAKNGKVTAVGVTEKSADQKYLHQYTEYVLCNVSELEDFLKKYGG